VAFIDNLIPNDKRYDIDLLDAGNARRFLSDPSRLRTIAGELPDSVEWIFIDEVQKIPEMLDVVHSLIEKTKLKFALTGSSARKLKRGGANLLAGRAFVYFLHPLTFAELADRFSLEHTLLWGSLPGLFKLPGENEKAKFLETYVHTYLKEEILEEQLVRKVEPFNHFLQVAAQASGEVINYSNIAESARSNYNSVKTFFDILEDTLIGFRLPQYHRSIRKRQGAKPKFYLFDNGVKRALDNSLRSTLPPWGNEYGRLFEGYIIGEFFRLNNYLERSYSLSFLRIDEKMEIDLVIETPNRETFLVEIKSANEINNRHLTNLRHFAADFPGSTLYCLSMDPTARYVDGIHILPWQEGISRIMKL
jgi:uncharacterized protein